MKLKVKKVGASPELTSALKIILKPGFAKPLPVINRNKGRSGILNTEGWDSYFWRMERDGITQSIIQLFALCPQKAYYRMVEGIEPKMKDRALEFGSYFHEALDKVYSDRKDVYGDKHFDNCCSVILTRLYNETKNRLQQTADIKDQQEFEINYGVCRVVLRNYFEKWRKEHQKIEWVDVERVFEFPYMMRDGTVIQIKGKFDGVFRDKKGKLWLFETKTKSQIDGNYIIDKMDFDLQVMIYLMGMKHVYGEQPMGVVYNLIRRPQQRFSGTYYKKPESIPQFLDRVDADIKSKMDDYFIRYEVSITAEDIQQYKLQDLDYIIERVYEWQQGGISNFRNSGACSMWNRPCEFLPICGRGDRTGYTQRETVFPELTEVSD